MVVYLSKLMIMRINLYVGISRMRRFRMVDMCKGKRKYDYEAPMTSSLSNCTWLEKEWKFRLLTTWHPSLHFFSFTWFIPLISFFPLLFSFLFFSFFQSLYFILLYFIIFFPFFLFHMHIFLFIFPYLDIFFSLFKALNSSLFFMHTIWILKKNYARDETKLWK
jgi:hypothetical protein